MKNKVNSKKKKSGRMNYNFERQVKSSVELVKILGNKRQKIIDNIEGTKATIGGTKAIDEAHIAEVQ
jgi:hypothetical protein